MAEKPHMLLDWVFDIPNQKLYVQITDDLYYEAYEGGNAGYLKRYKGVETRLADTPAWDQEKLWLSENYGHIIGYFQRDDNRWITRPDNGKPDFCPCGVGPDGRYLDHLQRRQAILESEDCALIEYLQDATVFETPDCGLTIYKRMPTRNVFYENVESEPSAYWTEHNQPCAMQPYSPGRRLSNYAEMAAHGIRSNVIEKCKKGEWDKPKHPELQHLVINPTK